MASLIDFIDDWLKKHPECKIDDVHETTAIDRHCSPQLDTNIGFVLAPMNKSDLFKTVAAALGEQRESGAGITMTMIYSKSTTWQDTRGGQNDDDRAQQLLMHINDFFASWYILQHHERTVDTT